jgi:hypothetical protein
MHIFSDERRRHLSKELNEKDTLVKKEENLRFPDYNGDRLALAKEDLDSWLLSYEAEYDIELKKQGTTDV